MASEGWTNQRKRLAALAGGIGMYDAAGTTLSNSDRAAIHAALGCIDRLVAEMDIIEKREQEAGERCGVPWAEWGVHWPEGVANRVLELQKQLVEQECTLEAAMPQLEGTTYIAAFGDPYRAL